MFNKSSLGYFISGVVFVCVKKADLVRIKKLTH